MSTQVIASGAKFKSSTKNKSKEKQAQSEDSTEGKQIIIEEKNEHNQSIEINQKQSADINMTTAELQITKQLHNGTKLNKEQSSEILELMRKNKGSTSPTQKNLGKIKTLENRIKKEKTNPEFF